MLIAARSSQDFACCWRATASARSKYASAFAASGSGDSSAISPAMRLTSASYHLSLLFRLPHCFADAAPSVIELAELRIGLAKYDKYNGIHMLLPLTAMQ